MVYLEVHTLNLSHTKVNETLVPAFLLWVTLQLHHISIDQFDPMNHYDEIKPF